MPLGSRLGITQEHDLFFFKMVPQDMGRTQWMVSDGNNNNFLNNE